MNNIIDTVDNLTVSSIDYLMKNIFEVFIWEIR